MSAPTLFDPAPSEVFATPARTRATGPVTSAAAAKRVGPRAGSQAAFILCALADGPDGTGHEAYERTKCSSAPCPYPYVALTRIGSLVKLGLAVASGETRLTPLGCPAQVWVATDQGRWIADEVQRAGQL